MNMLLNMIHGITVLWRECIDIYTFLFAVL